MNTASNTLPTPNIKGNSIGIGGLVNLASTVVKPISNIGQRIIGGPAALQAESNRELRREEDEDRNKMISLLEEIKELLKINNKNIQGIGDNSGGGSSLLKVLSGAAGTLGTIAAARGVTNYIKGRGNTTGSTSSGKPNLARRVADKFNPKPQRTPAPPNPKTAQTTPDGVRRIQLKSGGPSVPLNNVKPQDLAAMDDELARRQNLLNEVKKARDSLKTQTGAQAARPTATKPKQTSRPTATPTSRSPSTPPSTPTPTSTTATASPRPSFLSKSVGPSEDALTGLMGRFGKFVDDVLPASVVKHGGTALKAGGVAAGAALTGLDMYDIANNPLYDYNLTEDQQQDPELVKIQERMQQLKEQALVISGATGAVTTTLALSGVGAPIAVATGALGTLAGSIHEMNADIERSIEIPQKLAEIATNTAKTTARQKLQSSVALKETQKTMEDINLGDIDSEQAAFSVLTNFKNILLENKGKLRTTQDTEVFYNKIRELDLWETYKTNMENSSKDPIQDAPDELKDYARLLRTISTKGKPETRKSALQAATMIPNLEKVASEGKLGQSIKTYGSALLDDEYTPKSSAPIEVPTTEPIQEKSDSTISETKTSKPEITTIELDSSQFSNAVENFASITIFLKKFLETAKIITGNTMSVSADQPTGPALSGDSSATNTTEEAKKQNSKDSVP